MNHNMTIVGLLALTWIGPSYAATPREYAALDRRTDRACIETSGLRNAITGPVTRFSDRFGMDARTVSGTYPQAHMNGATGTMLCLYNRATRRAEVQETGTRSVPIASAHIKNVMWRGTAINGEPVGTSIVILMFGLDGKATGRSACNNYSVNYALTGNALRIYTGMIGTRMACPPPRMEQETQFRTTLAAVSMASVESDGSLLLRGPSGQSLRFVKDTDRRD
jgi:heat shock protein HslJ